MNVLYQNTQNHNIYIDYNCKKSQAEKINQHLSLIKNKQKIKILILNNKNLKKYLTTKMNPAKIKIIKNFQKFILDN